MLGSAQDAEDQVQETLLRAWRGFGGFEGRGVHAEIGCTGSRPTPACGRWRPAAAGRLCRPGHAPGRGTHTRRWPRPSQRSRGCRPVTRRGGSGTAPADPAAVVASRTSMRLALIAALRRLPMPGSARC